MVTRKLITLLFGLVVAGCSLNPQEGPGDYAPYPTGEYTDDDSESSGGPGEQDKFDVLNEDTGGNFDPDGNINDCKNVDFLFVIDNSGSMGDNQQNIINNFNVFINGLLEKIVELETVHIGVVTTDAFKYNPGPCQKLGALVTATADDICGPYVDGYNFMTENDPLETAFACAADVGTAGSGSERPLEATVGALEGFLNSDGQCNEDFSRDDAITVIVIVTDEDVSWDSNIETTFDHLTWLKTDESNIVLLTLTHIEGPDKCNNGWSGYSEDLITFTEMFTNGFVGDICEPSYQQFFEQAVYVVETACDMLPGHEEP